MCFVAGDRAGDRCVEAARLFARGVGGFGIVWARIASKAGPAGGGVFGCITVVILAAVLSSANFTGASKLAGTVAESLVIDSGSAGVLGGSAGSFGYWLRSRWDDTFVARRR